MRPRQDTTVCVEFDPLRRRCIRLAKAGEYRKAAIALAELANREQDPATWVRLGAMLMRAGKGPAAIDALKQGLWLHRMRHDQRRASVVIALIESCTSSSHGAPRNGRLRVLSAS
jgi:predicted TPR repeat methyltransferase